MPLHNEMTSDPATGRAQAIGDFLTAHGWGGAQRSNLAGDASFRRYERITHAGRGRAVLMDAPPDREDTRPFVQVTQFLRSCALSAPAILAQDEAQGFLLLEDLADESFSRVLRQSPEREAELYHNALDVLLWLHSNAQLRAPLKAMALPEYDHALLMREVLLFSQWFLPRVIPPDSLVRRQQEFEEIWSRLLRQHPPQRNRFVHRDFHADNLMHLPSREGVANVGLLDYQDATLGDAAYDLVSLLEDARRDVHPATVQAMIEEYCTRTDEDKTKFMQRYALLGAQRNCKIVGIFVRLCARDGKHHYLGYLPRVWGHLEHDLAHPQLAELQAWMEAHVPAAVRGALEGLKT